MLSSRPISFHADLDSQPIMNTKTPGRKALKNRAALQENALYSGAKTVFSKKSVLQTPFQSQTAHGKKQLVSVSLTRPLMDKTPFPNRVAPGGGMGGSKTPATKGFKLSKLSLLVPESEQPESPDAAPLLRPSSTRKTLRGRSSGTFKTPITKGDHWNVSPGDMELEVTGGTEQQAREEVAEISDEDEDIEYMPPTAIERPYEPLFELPDYTRMGSVLFNLGHAPLVDEALDVYYAVGIEQQVDMHELVAASGPTPGSSRGDELDLSDIDDNSPFLRKATAPRPAPTGSKTVRPSARGVINRPAPTGATRAMQGPARPPTAIPQTRSSSRTTGSPSSTPVPGPAPTRTSVLRAAKAAAASNSATTPHPIRPTASAGARATPAAVPRRPATSLAVMKPLVRSATVSGSAKPSAGSAVAPPRTRTAVSGPIAGRARSSTATASSSKGKAPAGPAAAVLDDGPLSMMLKGVGQGLEEDFQFEL